MRDIKFIAVHCTASSQNWTVNDLMDYFTKVKKWRKAGYHYVIDTNGVVTQLVALDDVSNGVYGYNKVTINIAYIGGIDRNGKPMDNRTPKQKASLLNLLRCLRKTYPTAIIQGHRDFPNVRKDCPCFNAKEEFKGV